MPPLPLHVFAFEMCIKIVLLPYQEREPGTTPWALGLLDQILQGLSRGNVGLILLQPDAVVGPRLLAFVSDILHENEMSFEYIEHVQGITLMSFTFPSFVD